MLRPLVLVILAVWLQCVAAPVRAAADPATVSPPDAASPMKGAVPAGSGIEFSWELDAYYTNVGVALPLDDRPVPDGGAMSEHDVYRTLFRESLHPRILLLEASVYPMPVAGTWMKKEDPDTYDNFTIGDIGPNQLNVIDGLTSGFQEPWAASAFLGGEMTFTRDGDVKRKGNRGYMGYLVSMGKKHIRSNVLIDDNWYEVEWKLKGEREFRDEQLNWSFRVGVKNHGNPGIRDVTYVGFRRSNLDFQRPFLSILNNSTMELKTEVARDTGAFMRQEIIFGKKLPIRRWRIAMALDVGLIWERDAKYTGALADSTIDPFTIVFHPNIDW